jgi:lipoprotein-anchoring transpeptidase ErfK/SrfK
MKSSHRRVSRALVIGVLSMMVLGVVFYLGKLSANAGKSAGFKEQLVRANATPIAPVIPTTVGKVAPSSQPSSVASAAATQSSGTTLLLSSAPQLVTETPTTRPTPHAGSGPNSQLASAALSGVPLVDAKSKLDSNKPLEARKILNTALVSNTLSEADAKSAKQFLNQINAIVVFSTKRFADDEFGGTFTVPPGGVLAKIAQSHEVSPDLLMRINGITDARRLRAGQNIKVLNGPFHALVSKGQFSLELWLGEPQAKGSMYITSFPAGLGKDDSTPSGVWAVQNKLKNPAYYSPRGQGIIAADDPKNPLGEFWIGLTGTDGHAVGKTSYGIHGTVDPNSIGKQESMGCIRLKNEDVAQVFDMLLEGKSTVTVKD